MSIEKTDVEAFEEEKKALGIGKSAEEKKEKPEDPENPEKPADKEPESKEKKPDEEDEPDEPEGDEPDEPEEDDEDKEPDEEDDEDLEDDDQEDGDRPLKYVPIDKHKATKERYKTKIAELNAKVEELSKASPAASDDLKAEIKKIAEETETSPEVLEKVIALATKAAQKNLEKSQQDNKPKVTPEMETTHFNKEWDSVAPSLKEQYPNANEDQLMEAKAIIDEAAHTKKFHDKEIGYIVYSLREALKDVLYNPQKQGLDNKGNETPADRPVVKSDVSKMSGKELADRDKVLKGIEQQSSSLKIDSI